MLEPRHAQHAQIFKAFCDENRLMILELLRQGEQNAASLLEELNIAQSTLSHHMKILVNAGVVYGHRVGKRTRYAINDEGCRDAIHLLSQLVRQPLG